MLRNCNWELSKVWSRRFSSSKSFRFSLGLSKASRKSETPDGKCEFRSEQKVLLQAKWFQRDSIKAIISQRHAESFNETGGNQIAVKIEFENRKKTFFKKFGIASPPLRCTRMTQLPPREPLSRNFAWKKPFFVSYRLHNCLLSVRL